MRLPVLISLLSLLPLAVAHADPVVAECPAEWSFGAERLPLFWANIWADYQVIDDEFGETSDVPGRASVQIELKKVDRRPLFLFCRYKEMSGFNVAVSIPEGAKTCMVEWQGAKWDAREKVNRDYVRALRAECRGTLQGEPSQAFPAEIPSLTSDVEGLRLRQPADELKALVLSRGGSWTQWAVGAPAEIALGDARLRVVFSSATGLSRKVVLYGPPWPPRDPGFYAAIIQRFGLPEHPYAAQCTKAWNTYGQNNDIQVEWYRPCKTDSPSAPQEMRLVDMADPESKKERE
ncbi:exported hypothetical protein [Magnetospirillum sp. LM-5]|uniref:hypothetical protein n=1 Tax=Magnetospirillum sp. LM-5 TaxID=2681466 RepID=UPI00138465F0|nr:hypothetical protein [Magnetospirillum sp. LM-5]CAA7614341.1 exported hypothetical protein [Magnetospirillum sp. LM-5]